MKRIVWKTRSRLLAAAFLESDAGRCRGGRQYELAAALALADCHDVRFDSTTLYGERDNPLSYFLRLRGKGECGDISVFDPFVIGVGHPVGSRKNIAVVHHLNLDLGRDSLPYRIFFAIIRNRLPSLDCVVTVSRYWEKFLKENGCRKVRVIYNSFPVAELAVTPQEQEVFLSQRGMSRSRPIIYLGPALAGKGWRDVYQALRHEGYQLVVTGPQSPGLPGLLHLDLPYREYLCLLSVSAVVVAMSTMMEGWNRVVHEAMLCRTPVIGSGAGGMGELLSGGGQFVAAASADLPQLVQQAMARSSEVGEAGYRYVSRFDMQYFRREWCNLMEELG